MSEIKFSCQYCSQTLASDAAAIGAVFPCPGCGKDLVVPAPEAPAEVEACDIFLSYRRQGGEHLARLVMKGLEQRGFSVFMDTENLRQGKFDTAILRNIELAKDVVVICSQGALDRCVNDDDWVRQEIRHALEQRKNIVRLTDRNFRMPARESLPPDIAALADTKSLPQAPGLIDATIERLGNEFLQSKPDADLRQIDEASDEGKTLAWAKLRMLIAGGLAGILLLMALVSISAVWHMDPRLHGLAKINWEILGTVITTTIVILLGARLCYSLNPAGPWLILVASLVAVLLNSYFAWRFLKFVGHLTPYLRTSMPMEYVKMSINVVPFLLLAWLYRKGK